VTNYPLCVVDGRPVHDAGKLCTACWADLEHDLTELAESLLHDLDRVLAGATRSGSSPIGIVVRAERGLGFNEAAGDLLRELHNTLGGWVRVLFEDNFQTPELVCSLCFVEQRHHAEGPADRPRYWYVLNAPMVRDDTADFARWLDEHEREIRRHEAVGELWQGVHDLAEEARRITRPAREPKVYLGVCSVHIVEADGERIYCDAELYAPAGWQGIRCPGCGTMHAISQRREVMLSAVAEQLLTAVECSRALTAMTGAEVSVNTIRSWAHRGKLDQHDPREGETSPRYRVGDVEALVVQSITQKAG
jgi:hypothetical protein